jgi:transcriptional regulator with XRE-family HTH domain
MPKRKADLALPAANALRKLGQDINEARRRRRITKLVLAERAGIAPMTLDRIERGDGGTAMGGYASVLFSLGMLSRLRDIADARYDLTGLQLAAEQLPKTVRPPRKRIANV